MILFHIITIQDIIRYYQFVLFHRQPVSIIKIAVTIWINKFFTG